MTSNQTVRNTQVSLQYFRMDDDSSSAPLADKRRRIAISAAPTQDPFNHENSTIGTLPTGNCNLRVYGFLFTFVCT
jgi:hypothetical protein